MSSRLSKFDLLKLVLAILVVNLHVESFVTTSPFSYLYYLGWYAVPIFVTLSFYFNAKYLVYAPQVGTLKLKLARLFTPFIFWSVVGFVVHPELISPKYILRQLLMGTAVDAPLYYLLIVMHLMIVFYLLFKRYPGHKLAPSIIMVFLIFEESGYKSGLASILPIQIEFFVSRGLELVKYAALGVTLHQLRAVLTTLASKSKALTWLSIPLMILYPLSQWVSRPSHLDYSGLTQFVAVGSFMVFLISSKDIKNHLLVSLSRLGSYTLGIYCLHTFLIELANILVSKGWLVPRHLTLTLFISLLALAISHFLARVQNLKLAMVVE